MDNVEYVPNEYEPVEAVRAMSAIPRFGRTSQFSKLFSVNNQEQTDYIMGLIFLAAFLMTFFFLWTVSIFVFMCLGQREAGFLSGHPFVEPEMSGDNYLDPKPFRRPRRVRWTFLACNILVVMFSVFFVTHGMKNIQTTTATLNESNIQVKELAKNSRMIANDLNLIGEESVPIRDTLVKKLGNFCPKNPDLEDQTGVDFDGITSQAVENLNLLQDFIENEVVEFGNYLGQVENATEDFETVINSYDVSEWKVMLYILPVIILSAFLLIGLLMAWFEVSFREYQCMLKYFVIPLFGIAIVFSWVFCGLFGLLSTTNADFCSGGVRSSPSPDGTFLEIIDGLQINENSIVYKSLEYYIDGCRTGFPFSFISTFRGELAGALNSTRTFSNSLDGVGLQSLNDLCGEDFTAMAGLLNNTQKNLQILIEDAALGLRLLSCRSINSIYTNTFHEGTCTYSVSGFTWVFSSLLIVSFCGMLMITFRAAVYDVVWYEDFADPATVEGDGDLHMDPEPNKEQPYDYDERGQLAHTQPEMHVYESDRQGPIDDEPTEESRSGKWEIGTPQGREEVSNVAAL